MPSIHPIWHTDKAVCIAAFICCPETCLMCVKAKFMSAIIVPFCNMWQISIQPQHATLQLPVCYVDSKVHTGVDGTQVVQAAFVTDASTYDSMLSTVWYQSSHSHARSFHMCFQARQQHAQPNEPQLAPQPGFSRLIDWLIDISTSDT